MAEIKCFYCDKPLRITRSLGVGVACDKCFDERLGFDSRLMTLTDLAEALREKPPDTEQGESE